MFLVEDQLSSLATAAGPHSPAEDSGSNSSNISHRRSHYPMSHHHHHHHSHPSITISTHHHSTTASSSTATGNITDLSMMSSPTGSDHHSHFLEAHSKYPSPPSCPSPAPSPILLPTDDSQKPLPHETFFGYLDTPQDALILMEAARLNGLGLLPKVKSRLSSAERSAIRSGSIFVFDQEEASIKRWTDGLNWSPSRIHNGCYLIYRQIVKPEDNNAPAMVFDNQPRGPFVPGDEADLNEPGFNAQLRDGMVVKKNGLVKKTISLDYEGRHVHVISYYYRADVLAGRLPIPSRTEALGNVEIPALLKETLLKNSLTKTVPMSKETAASLSTNPALYTPPTRHNSDPSVHSARRAKSRALSRSPIRRVDGGLERSNSLGGHSGSMYLLPPSPHGVSVAPSFESLLVPHGGSRSRSRSPSGYSSSPPIDGIESARFVPYRARRDSTSSTNSWSSGGYDSLRRRASSSARSITSSPMMEALTINVNGMMVNGMQRTDHWSDGSPPVSALPSPNGSDYSGNMNRNDSNMMNALTTAFRFEITAPDDEPLFDQTSAPPASMHPNSPAIVNSTLSESIAFLSAALGEPSEVRRPASPSTFSYDSVSSSASSAPSLSAPGSISPASRPSSPAESSFLSQMSTMSRLGGLELPPPSNAATFTTILQSSQPPSQNPNVLDQNLYELLVGNGNGQQQQQNQHHHQQPQTHHYHTVMQDQHPLFTHTSSSTSQNPLHPSATFFTSSTVPQYERYQKTEERDGATIMLQAFSVSAGSGTISSF
ncbi:hypothetical protein HDU97_003307 [Phlyctochytrium planicorne]|nr:hypothetical protein HDU97_003307 [Phlyctochytrium planicorne]